VSRALDDQVESGLGKDVMPAADVEHQDGDFSSYSACIPLILLNSFLCPAVRFGSPTSLPVSYGDRGKEEVDSSQPIPKLMETMMNRRHWLGRSALAAAAVALARIPARATPARVGGELIKLDQNENPYGISQRTEQAIMAAMQSAHRYPHGELEALRDLIAEREKVPRNCVALGAGSTEILSHACLLFGAKGKEVLVAEPTYAGFTGYVELHNGALLRAPVNERWETDFDRLAGRLNKHSSLVYICNPNNPTGTMTDSARLRQFCEDVAGKAIVVVDEAYYELVEDSRRASMVDLVRKGASVIVARTFSKLYGLAGLRVGYGIAKPELTAQLLRFQANLSPLSQLSLAAARAAYEDVNHLALSRERNAQARAGLYQVLDRLGQSAIPGSQTNFVTFEPKGGAERLVASLRRDYDISVRPFQFLGKSWVRVSMGTPEEMSRLSVAMGEIL
jgi:histidinol-phosphate aminotransferase